TIDWDSIEKIQKILCYNSMPIRKFGTFSFHSPRAVRWGITTSLLVPAKTWVFVLEIYIATDLTQFRSPQLCTNSKEKSEINIYYTLAILNLLNVFSKLCFPISVEI